MTESTIKQYGKFIIVPVVDEDDGTTIEWDVHHDEVDWSSGEPIATARTQAGAIAELRALLKVRRSLGFDLTR